MQVIAHALQVFVPPFVKSERQSKGFGTLR